MARWREGLAVTSEGRGVDRVESQEVILHQGIDERATRLLQAEGELASAKACSESRRPLVNGLRRVRKDGSLSLSCRQVDGTDVMLTIRPVDADAGSVLSPGSPPGRESTSAENMLALALRNSYSEPPRRASSKSSLSS